MPLPNEYFDQYADQSSGEDRSYSSNWKSYGFQLFEAYKDILLKGRSKWPRNAIDIGAANGLVIEEFLKLGIDAYGIESSRYIYDQAKPDIKKRIAFGDALDILKNVPDNKFELVHDTVAQYIPKDKLKHYLSELRRICVKDLVIVLHTMEVNPEAHQFQVNHLHDVTWRRLLKDAGFIERGPIDDHPFYFGINA